MKDYQNLCSCEREKGGGLGIFVMNVLDFVEVKRNDHNNLQNIAKNQSRYAALSEY